MYLFLMFLLLVFNGIFNGIPPTPFVNNIEDLLLVVMFFYLTYMPKREVFTIVVLFAIYKVYITLTSLFIEHRPFIMMYIENMTFLFVLMFQHYKNYNLNSDRISSKTVCLIFYKPKSFSQYFVSLFGMSVASSGAIIKNKVYMLVRNKSTLQELDFDKKQIEKDYLIMDTKVKVECVMDIIPELLLQKARQPRTLYLRYNCLRCLVPLLNRLGGRWKYKGELFPSVYVKNKVDLRKRK